MKEYLKVKLCSLAAEIRIIKTQEQRTKEKLAKRRSLIGQENQSSVHIAQMQEHNKRGTQIFCGLRDHRRGLRHETRLSHLVYGFLRGIPFSKMEFSVHQNHQLTESDWTKMETMAKRFAEGDSRDIMQRWAQFKDSSKECIIIGQKMKKQIVVEAAATVH